MAHHGKRTKQWLLEELTTLSKLSERLLARVSYIYIMMIVSLDRSFVFNSCNSQYSKVSIVVAIPRPQSSSKELLFVLHLYLVLLKEQPLHADIIESV